MTIFLRCSVKVKWWCSIKNCTFMTRLSSYSQLFYGATTRHDEAALLFFRPKDSSAHCGFLTYFRPLYLRSPSSFGNSLAQWFWPDYQFFKFLTFQFFDYTVFWFLDFLISWFFDILIFRYLDSSISRMFDISIFQNSILSTLSICQLLALDPLLRDWSVHTCVAFLAR